MDKKDEKILTQLVLNSKISFKQLGKKAGVSREVAAYRVKKLVEEKIITEFYPHINVEKLGYIRNGCGMQLRGISLAKEKEFFSFLVNHPFVTYIGVVLGKWNVAFDILSKNREHLVSVIQEIIYEIKPYLEDYMITNSSTEQEVYPTKILGIKMKGDHIKNNSIVNIDQADKKILQLLSVNSRIEYTELSSKLRLSANAVKYRIRRLESTGIIQGYTASIDATKLGYEFYNMQVKLDPGISDSELKNFLRAHPRVFYFYKYFGHENWDIDIGIIAKNSKDLREVIVEFRTGLGKMMKIQDIYTNVEILKGDIAPKGIFE